MDLILDCFSVRWDAEMEPQMHVSPTNQGLFAKKMLNYRALITLLRKIAKLGD